MADDDRPSPAALTFPAGGSPAPADVGLGYIALVCGLVAWAGECLILLAELGWIPRAVKLGGATLVVVGLC